MRKLIDYIDPQLKIELCESDSIVDGEHILAKVRGQFCVPDGESRNRRFYPREVWEKTMANKEINAKMKDRLMFGTISHEQKLGDTALLEGKVSHFVYDLNPQTGIGEAYVLNTPAGQILNTLLRAKCKLYVSSRADGTLEGTRNGLPVVDPETFQLETFDFVINPGFLQARPDLTESINDYFNTGDSKMDHKDLLESFSKKNEELNAKLLKITEEKAELEADLEIEKKNNETLAKRTEELEKDKEASDEYKELGSAEEIKEVFAKLQEVTAKLREFLALGDSPAQIKEALEMAERLCNAYEKLGSPRQITTAFNVAEKFKRVYEKFGTPKEIKEVFAVVAKMNEEKKIARKNASIKKLAEELSVPVAKIEKVWGKLSEKEIRETFEGITSAPVKTDMKRPETKEKKVTKIAESKEKKEEGLGNKKPRVFSLMESVSGIKLDNE